MNNQSEITLDWNILVAKKTQQVFFVVNGEGQPKEAMFDPQQRKVSFTLNGKKCCLQGIPEEVTMKLAEASTFLNIKDDKKMLILDTAIRLPAPS